MSSADPDLEQALLARQRDISSVGGRLDKLVQQVAKDKLQLARNTLRMSADY